MIKNEYIYDPDEQTMVFSVDTKRHVRVAYCDGQVWYAMTDIAKLLRYRSPSKAQSYWNCEVRLLRVPHTSEHQRGYTNCNCIRKDALKRILDVMKGDHEIRDWILYTVIPQAEQKLAAETVNTPAPERPEPSPEIMPQVAEVLDKLDQFIIAAVTLRREIQPR